MRFVRRWRVAVSATAALMVALTAIATAVRLVPGSSFTGASTHRHYVVTLLPECFTRGCTKATTIGVQLTTGNPRHPGAKCVYGTFQLPNAKLKSGKFTTSGQASTVSKTFTLKVTGTFTTSTRAHGTVTGPKACGGTDGYRVIETPAGG